MTEKSAMDMFNRSLQTILDATEKLFKSAEQKVYERLRERYYRGDI